MLKEKFANGIFYHFDEKEQHWIVAGCNSISSEIKIEDEIDGYPVRIIDCNVFRNMIIESVLIPDTITDIETDAFSNSTIINIVRYVTMSDYAETSLRIHMAAFSNCRSLAIGNFGFNTHIELYGRHIFANCEKLKMIIGQIIGTIPQSTFLNCKNLENLLIYGCIAFAKDCFVGCNKLKKIQFCDVTLFTADENIVPWLKTIQFYCGKNEKIIQELAYEGYNVCINGDVTVL